MDEEITDAELAQLEEQIKELGGEADDSPIPSQEKKDNILALFREMIKSQSSVKFANLDNKDLGNPRMAVRDQLDIANYLEGEGHTKLGNYFRQKAEITLGTSMSHKGWFGNLIVTQIKKEQTIRPQAGEQKKSFWGRFGGGSNEQQQ